MILNCKEDLIYLMECVKKEIQSLEKDLISDIELINLRLINSPNINEKSQIETLDLTDEIFKKISNFQSEIQTLLSNIEKKLQINNKSP